MEKLSKVRRHVHNDKMQKMNTKSFLRQLFVCSGPWTLYFLQGICIGFPTVLVPQLRKNNQTIDDETASWLPATHTYSGIPWLVILSALIIAIGRKKSHIVVCISSLVGFIIFYFSTNITHILVGECFQGALSSSYLTTCIIILTECVSSKYRGTFLTFKSATFFWGILVANAIGTFFHWRNIAILGIVCGVYTLLNVIIWPESPYWLASKGRFEECAAAHRWLKGEGEESEKELEKLLKSHENRRFVKQQWGVQNILKTICRKQFIKPILLANLLVCLYSFSGKLVCTVYAIDILKKISSSESLAYTGMLILDGITVFSMYLGCFISKLVKRRVMLIGFTVIGIMFLISISVYLYLAKLAIIDENKYVSIVLLAGYAISISCGPMIMSTSIIGELLPLDCRTLSMFLVALTFKLTYGTFIKISPLIFKSLGMHGTFALYAVLSSIFLVLIYLYVPETKDKTLQEIDDCLSGKAKIEVEEGTGLINVNIRNLVDNK